MKNIITKKQVAEYVDIINDILYKIDKQPHNELVVDLLTNLRQIKKLLIDFVEEVQ
jgi:hypothetical protein